MMEESHEIMKLVLLGDPSVGKTCYFMRYSSDQFNPDHLTTIGVDYYLNEIELENGNKIHIQLWDTAGQERFRTITKNYIKGAQGIILVYDITNPKTFEGLGVWMKQIKDIAIENIQVVLVGNKCDLEEKRQVQAKDGEAMSRQYNIEFFETSAKANIKIVDVIKTLAEKTFNEYILAKDKESKYQADAKKLIELENEKKQIRRRRGCCNDTDYDGK